MIREQNLKSCARQIHRLGANEAALLVKLNMLFAEVFDEPETYAAAAPDALYLTDLLGDDCFVALVATEADEVVGGLVAYALRKFEQERREVYIYDLAVAAHRRRQGIATNLIEFLKPIAQRLGAWVIFVQADQGDFPAIALYEKLGNREEVLHFDIPIR